MDVIDLLFRGAAIGSALFIAIGIIAGDAPARKSTSVAVLSFCVVGYLIASSPSFDGMPDRIASVFVLGAILAPVAFIWMILEILFDDLREKWIWIGLAALSVIPALLAEQFSFLLPVRGVLVLSLYLGLLYLAVLSGPDDLVEKRRMFRRFFVGSMALLGIIISVVDLGYEDAALPAFIFPLQAATFFALSIVFELWAFKLSDDI